MISAIDVHVRRIAFEGWLTLGRSSMGRVGTALVVASALSAPHVIAQSPPAQTAAPAPAAAPAGDAEQGRKLFVSYGCYQCHGYEAQGADTGPRLGPRPVPFASFSRYVRRPTGQMPPYTTTVATDASLADIYAFLQARPAPRPVGSIPLLNDSR